MYGVLRAASNIDSQFSRNNYGHLFSNMQPVSLFYKKPCSQTLLYTPTASTLEHTTPCIVDMVVHIVVLLPLVDSWRLALGNLCDFFCYCAFTYIYISIYFAIDCGMLCHVHHIMFGQKSPTMCVHSQGHQSSTQGGCHRRPRDEILKRWALLDPVFYMG